VEKELPALSLINQQLMDVYTFFIALIVLLIGVFRVYSTSDILHTGLGHQVSFGLFIFWCTRLVFQFWVYTPNLWKRKLLESAIHIVFSLLWAYFSIVFFIICSME